MCGGSVNVVEEVDASSAFGFGAVVVVVALSSVAVGSVVVGWIVVGVVVVAVVESAHRQKSPAFVFRHHWSALLTMV